MKPRLVGVKYRSIFSKVFFFQYLLVNHCHRQLEDLRHPKHDLLPSHLQYFVAALCYLPDIWNSQSSIEKIFYAEGHRSTYVQTVVSFVQSLKDQLALCQGRLYVMDECGSTSNNDNIVLKADQNAVFISVKESLQERQQFYQKHKAPPIVRLLRHNKNLPGGTKYILYKVDQEPVKVCCYSTSASIVLKIPSYQ